jgi:hypothetical protein
VPKHYNDLDLTAAAIRIAKEVRQLDTDQRCVLYGRVAAELRIHGQNFSARCFEAICDIDSGRRPL